MRTAFAALLCVFVFFNSTEVFAQATTPAGTLIQNTARIRFTDGNGAPVEIASNTVSATVAQTPSRSSITLLRAGSAGASLQSTAGPTQCVTSAGASPLEHPVLSNGAAVDPMQPIAMSVASSVHGGEAVFVQITDQDQNQNAQSIDVIELRLTTPSGDAETLRVSETGANTGMFVGYIQTRASAVTVSNCVLEVERNSQIASVYTDAVDPSDVSSASALVDPYGLVFDSRTGQAINGARVRLINDATGVAAAVVGDDGVSSYPSEMVTGQSVTDAGGTVYTLPNGVFRFPLVAPGAYRLEVTPPAGHAFPSALSVEQLAQTPGAPYRVSTGSFGAAFLADGAPAVAVDIPLDAAATQLFMQKSTTTTVAAVGDFVQYTLTLENTSSNAALSSARIVDRLPMGVRYRAGSARMAGAAVADPEISLDGQTLTFNVGVLAPGQRIEVRYVVELTVGVHGKQLVNYAQGVGPDGAVSNSAQATIELREELFRDRAIIMGRVVEGECDKASSALQGVAGVRVYLEDGRYSVTDESGKYHFDDVTPGAHVVQMDTVTVPASHEALDCRDSVRKAGRAYSEFVDVRGGALWRSDFVLKRKKPPEGQLTLELGTSLARASAFETEPAPSLSLPRVTGEGTNTGGSEPSSSLPPATGGEAALRTPSASARMHWPESPHMDVSRQGRGEGEQGVLQHAITLNAARVPVSNVRVLVMLPEGVTYLPGSVRLDDVATSEPAVASGVLTFKLAELAADAPATLTFSTAVSDGASGGLAIKATALFDAPAQKGQRTAPVENLVLRGQMLYENASYRFSPRFDVLAAEIQPSDRAQLDKIIEEWRGVTNLSLVAIGHTDQTLIAQRSRTEYADNYELSRARAAAVADYLGKGLGIDPARVTIEGRGADEPLTQGQDAHSRALNRRVEIEIEGLRVRAAGGLTVRTASARSESVATVGALTLDAPSLTLPRLGTERHGGSSSLGGSDSSVGKGALAQQLDVEALQSGTAFVLPTAGAVPAIPSIKVAIQHSPHERVELLINGAAVSPLNYDGAVTNQAKSVSLSRWRGVDLRDGENTLIAVVRDAQGAELQRLARTVQYTGGAVRAELVRDASLLIADGRTRPVIALRMLDAAGQSARPGTTGAFRVEAPHRSAWEVETLHENKLVTVGEREPTFSVDQDGLARLALEPTTQAGTAVLRLRLGERREQEVRVWLEPQARDWILVGIAEGTSAYRTIRDNMQSAAQAGLEDGYAEDGRVAFFTKGAIKGDFLLTAAYDSAREHELTKDRLHGVVEPDRFYTLYGDATEQRFEAATTRKLYVKLERRQFAALFGDFETGLTVTELSRYSRTFTGFKTDYAGEHFGYSAFAAESEQGYVQDLLQGDGTSGLYRLSRRPLIVNSERIRLEVRDRFRSEVVVESRPLTPFIDYSIDYLNGTLFFKQPVPSRDQNFNPLFIVAEYEVLNGGEQQMTAGGRAALKLANDALEIGASFIQEGAAAGDTRVAGTDLRWRLSDATELRAEAARSESDEPASVDANAYLTELTHLTENLDARAYVREQQEGFGVGQQLATEAGSRKFGVDGRYRLSETLALEGETYRQEVLTTGAERELVSVEVRRELDDYSIGAGARHVSDTGLSTGEAQSQHAFVNGSIDLFDDRITLRASQDLALGDQASIDFPTRSTLGADYHWRPDTTFFAEYEHADGDAFDADMTRVGVRARPWSQAQLQSSMNSQATEYGPRVFANVGLTQGWRMNERWSFDVGVDQSKTVSGAQAAAFNPNSPLASGSLGGDFLATFAGAMYRSDLWTFTSRLENRNSDDEDRQVFSGGFYREPIAGHAFSLATQWFASDFATGADAAAGEVQLGWAYRPVTSDWILLNRLDLKQEERTDAQGDYDSARVVNNFNANWQLDRRTQLGLQFGARHVRSTFDDERYSGTSTLYGLDTRRDLTERFDVGLHGTLLQSLKADVSEHAVGVDVGVTLATNVWISIGYNFAGFRDEDFEASRYTAQGPFIKFRMKADQDTFRDALRLRSGD